MVKTFEDWVNDMREAIESVGPPPLFAGGNDPVSGRPTWIYQMTAFDAPRLVDLTMLAWLPDWEYEEPSDAAAIMRDAGGF